MIAFRGWSSTTPEQEAAIDQSAAEHLRLFRLLRLLRLSHKAEQDGSTWAAAVAHAEYVRQMGGDV